MNVKIHVTILLAAAVAISTFQSANASDRLRESQIIMPIVEVEEQKLVPTPTLIETKERIVETRTITTSGANKGVFRKAKMASRPMKRSAKKFTAKKFTAKKHVAMRRAQSRAVAAAAKTEHYQKVTERTQTFAMPPVIEKIIEKPTIIEKTVETTIEKPVVMEKIIEQPVLEQQVIEFVGPVLEQKVIEIEQPLLEKRVLNCDDLKEIEIEVDD